jgi:predicted nucleic acid-binding protein
LDTNVISELQKSNCHENVKKFAEEVSGDDIYISVITLGELCYGVEKLPAGKKKHELSIWLYTKVEEWFYNRIIELDAEVLMEWGKIRANASRTLPVVDTMIAACAITHHMFLVTRNTKDFEDVEGINLLNPWEY